MLLNQAALVILFVIFCGFNKVWGKGHGHSSHGGHGGHAGGRSSSHSSSSSISHSHHTGNSAGRSRAHRKIWSSYSSGEQITSDTSKTVSVSPAAYDSYKYSPPNYNFNDYKSVAYQQRTPYHAVPQSLQVNELDDFITGYITGRVGIDSIFNNFNNKSPPKNDNSALNYQYYQPYQPPIVIPPSLGSSFQGESKTNDEIFSAKQTEIRSNNFESLNLNRPLAGGISSSVAVHCQQQLHSEFNERGEIVDSVQNICKPLTTTAQPTTTTVKTLETPSTTNYQPYAAKEKRYERILASTPRGINCRKVMNSELNERGEIIDSVTEVCDPPTTTTTTTRKPTVRTTRRRPTTTPKPLVKVCRRVMDSYLNDAGEIIDSVTEVCTMEPVK